MAVVNANYVKRNENERQTAKANIYYIQTRPGRDKQRQSRVLFGPGGPMSRHEAYEFINAAPEGTYFYRLKLSPDPLLEDGKRDLNMQKLTRAMMQRLEKRLNTAIPWAAALHDDHTDIRHVHILAAIPKRLQQYELEFLIREATQLCEQQRRFLDRGRSRLPWLEPSSQPPLKTGKYTFFLSEPRQDLSADRHDNSNVLLPHRERWGRAHTKPHTSCTCPRCHAHQRHDRRGSHSCQSCGLILHKKKEPTLQRRKGAGWERSR
jgi:hypothetical protein